MRSASHAASVALLLALAPALASADEPAKAAPPATAPATAAPAKAAPPATAPAKPTAAPATAAKPATTAKSTWKPKAKKKARGPITGPVATYPSFRMLDGGASRVSVALSKKVTVTELKAEGKLTYRIAGVQVPTRTNRLPLLTTFFATPVTRAELVERDGDVDLVIEVKSGTTAQHRIVETDKGVELQVDFAKLPDAPKTEPEDGGSAANQPPAARPAQAKSLDKSDSAY